MQGLDAFTPEDAPAPEPGSDPSADRMRLVAGARIVVVALQAYPSVAWMRSAWRGKVEPVAAAAPAPVLPPAPAPNCEAVPASSSVAANAAAPAASPAATPPAAATPAAAATPQMLAGMLTVTAPLPLRVYLKGRLVGTSEAESTMLPQGTHELEFVNEAAGFRTRKSVAIRPGATSPVRIDVPNGTININAVPWAEVWIDGQRIGETPIGNLAVRIGSREIVFKNPDFGERRTTALVTVKEPTRISMDLRKK
jgi:hypothetical protein